MPWDLTDEEKRELYKWVDTIPLSKAKSNIRRDFSDGVSVAQIIKFHFQKLVDLHNYPSCNGIDKKRKNWDHLNNKVLKKLNFELGKDVIEDLIRSKDGVIEKVLHKLRNKIDQALWTMKTGPQGSEPAFGAKLTGRQDSYKTEVDQYYDSPGRRGQKIQSLSQTRGGTVPVSYHDPPPNREVVHDHNTQNIPTRPIEPFVPNPAFAHHHHQQQIRQQHQPAAFGGLPDLDTVSTLMYEDKLQESIAKDETIQILQAKIMRLEHLVHLKNCKVDDLNRQLDEVKLHERQKRPSVKQRQF